jgi:hypothetical protein
VRDGRSGPVLCRAAGDRLSDRLEEAHLARRLEREPADFAWRPHGWRASPPALSLVDTHTARFLRVERRNIRSLRTFQ